MKIIEFKNLLTANDSKQLQLILPNGNQVPVSFHITEIGLVHKTFIDCGGTLRDIKTCQLQIWVGADADHRLEASKAKKIFKKAESFLVDEEMSVEIEYEDLLISQYNIIQHQVSDSAIILHLGVKHTDCLAKELCGLPAVSPKNESKSCCGSDSNCC